MLTSRTGVSRFQSQFHSLCQLPADVHAGRQQIMAQVQVSLPLTWETQSSSGSWLLLCLCYCRNLNTEPVDSRAETRSTEAGRAGKRKEERTERQKVEGEIETGLKAKLQNIIPQPYCIAYNVFKVRGMRLWVHWVEPVGRLCGLSSAGGS